MLTAHELFGFMSPDMANTIIQDTLDTDRDVYRATMAAVAEAKRLRLVFFERKSKGDRHKDMIATLSRPRLEEVSANLIRNWLTKKQTAVLETFLDSMGIEHEKGIVNELPETVEEEKLASAITLLLEKFPKEVVAIYLNAFNEMNDVDWPSLKTLLESDDRLQLIG